MNTQTPEPKKAAKSPVKEWPILFQTDMVQAMLRNEKDVTRRITGKELKMINENPDDWEYKTGSRRTINRLWDSTKEECPNPLKYGWDFTNKHSGETVTVWSPYGKPGDLLYVRETWAKVPATAYGQSLNVVSLPIDQYMVAIYRAGWDRSAPTWQPSIHLPKDASRLWLENVSIRVERLLDITEEDAKREGIRRIKPFSYPCYLCDSSGHKDASILCRDGFFSSARFSYFTLWDSINAQRDNGAYETIRNPWVIRLEYKVLSRTGRP